MGSCPKGHPCCPLAPGALSILPQECQEEQAPEDPRGFGRLVQLGSWVGYKRDIQHEQVGCLGEEEGEETGRKTRRKQRRNERRGGRGTVGGGRTMKIKEEEEEEAMEGGEGKRSKGRLKWGWREEREWNPTYSPMRTSLINFPWNLPRSSQLRV